MAPVFFESAQAFRRWLELHHASEPELWLGFYKKGSGRAGITYEEALNEALCHGWIDGKLRRIDDVCHQVRFTRRKPTSHWSASNIRRVGELTQAGRMTPAGLAVFDPARAAMGPHERGAAPLTLSAAYEKRLRAHEGAWRFFEAQPPSYRRNAQFWVMSAKRDETRERRLALLIDACARGERLGQLSMQPQKKV